MLVQSIVGLSLCDEIVLSVSLLWNKVKVQTERDMSESHCYSATLDDGSTNHGLLRRGPCTRRIFVYDRMFCFVCLFVSMLDQPMNSRLGLIVFL